jgi:hemerythrin
MDAFAWDPWFLTGLPTVDKQHHRLVDLINAYGQTLTAGASTGNLETVFAELADYAQFHFQDEEALMLSHRLDADHQASHQAEHRRFLEDVQSLHEKWLNSPAQERTLEARRLLDHLVNWLAYHILGTDQLMTRLINAVRQGQSQAQAQQQFLAHRDPATATLLQAMRHLLSQLSDRSRALAELNQTLGGRVADRTAELQRLNVRLEALAMTDALTGLGNRRQALAALEARWEQSTANQQPLSCMMIDADGFKQVNDTWGHDAGDLVLKTLARCLAHAVRNDDLVCRLGGDEFLILCAHTPLAGALKTAHKVHQEVSQLRIRTGQGEWAGRISLGVAQRQPEHTSPQDLLKAADDGVYLAKDRGRNNVATVQTP